MGSRQWPIQHNPRMYYGDYFPFHPSCQPLFATYHPRHGWVQLTQQRFSTTHNSLPLHLTQVLPRLMSWQRQNPSTRLVIMPSTRDAHHAPVFPQPAMPAPDSVTSIQNPSSFAANDVSVAAVSHDVLKHLSASEVSRVPQGQAQDRLASLACHLVGQRRCVVHGWRHLQGCMVHRVCMLGARLCMVGLRAPALCSSFCRHPFNSYCPICITDNDSLSHCQFTTHGNGL